MVSKDGRHMPRRDSRRLSWIVLNTLDRLSTRRRCKTPVLCPSEIAPTYMSVSGGKTTPKCLEIRGIARQSMRFYNNRRLNATETDSSVKTCLKTSYLQLRTFSERVKPRIQDVE